MFQFKQFSIEDKHTAMKIGTDGILLGSWIAVENKSHLLDVGTGTGVIAIMSAQKNETAIIKALEIDAGALIDAQLNIDQSPWACRIELINASLQDYKPKNSKFDLIVSNPPFFVNSQKATVEKRSLARHTDTLHYADLFEFANYYLTEKGTLNIILPTEQAKKCIEDAKNTHLKPTRICEVFPNPTKKAHRWLIEFTLSTISLPAEQSKLIIETGIKRHDYTAEYTALCKAFYLHF